MQTSVDKKQIYKKEKYTLQNKAWCSESKFSETSNKIKTNDSAQI